MIELLDCPPGLYPPDYLSRPSNADASLIRIRRLESMAIIPPDATPPSEPPSYPHSTMGVSGVFPNSGIAPGFVN